MDNRLVKPPLGEFLLIVNLDRVGIKDIIAESVPEGNNLKLKSRL